MLVLSETVLVLESSLAEPHAEGFLKAVGRKPSGEGSRFTGRLTGKLGLLRYHLPITRLKAFTCPMACEGI